MLLGEKIKVQQMMRSDATDEELLLYKQMGIRYAYVYFNDYDSNYEDMKRFQEKLKNYGIEITDACNAGYYKNPSIHLGLKDRDICIDRYIDFTKNLAKLGIKLGYMTWDSDVYETKHDVGKYSRGSKTRIVEEADIPVHDLKFGRHYDEKEIWENCEYFLKKVMPVLKEYNMKIAFHPDDPPVPCFHDVCNLIWRSDDYRRLFALVNDDPHIVMKFCVGCWLQGGAQFGNLMEDLEEFVKKGKVAVVHFRNVSGTLPYFEETLIEDGYMDMYRILRRLIELDYDGVITIDHPLEMVEKFGGKRIGNAYMVGYLKGMLDAAIKDVNNVNIKENS